MSKEKEEALQYLYPGYGGQILVFEGTEKQVFEKFNACNRMELQNLERRLDAEISDIPKVLTSGKEDGLLKVLDGKDARKITDGEYQRQLELDAGYRRTKELVRKIIIQIDNNICYHA